MGTIDDCCELRQQSNGSLLPNEDKCYGVAAAVRVGATAVGQFPPPSLVAGGDRCSPETGRRGG
jgi:hypothetical protein